MARNYQEDQKNELEAIESIYFNELEIIEPDYPGIKFSIKICTEEYLETDDGFQCSLQFNLAKNYPDEAPIIEFIDDNFDEDESGTVKGKVNEEIQRIIEENIGTEMIFTLVAGIQEHLNTLFDGIKVEREEEKIRKKLAFEEQERKKFEGTRVTVETFMKWKNQFEIDLGIAEKRIKENEGNRKLTGRELFMKDSSLIDSDIASILQAGDTVESVKIDESLFSALDLEEELPSDDESDDPDYAPE